jgi:hypothetical protein
MLFPCPANFQPAPAVVAVIAGRWPGLDIDFELAKFTLYFSVEHPRVKRKGWDLSFLGWCERTASRPARASAAPFGAAASPGGRRKSGGEWLDEAIDRMDGTVIEGERE